MWFPRSRSRALKHVTKARKLVGARQWFVVWGRQGGFLVPQTKAA
jgi:hypothetical protein